MRSSRSYGTRYRLYRSPWRSLGPAATLLIVCLLGGFTVLAFQWTGLLAGLKPGATVPYPNQWEGACAIAGVRVSGKGTYMPGLPVPSTWQTLGAMGDRHVVADPDGAFAPCEKYCNIEVMVGDYYSGSSGFVNKLASFIGYSDQGEVDSFTVETDNKGAWNVSRKVKYAVEVWQFDVYLRFTTVIPGEVEKLLDRWAGDDEFKTEMSGFGRLVNLWQDTPVTIYGKVWAKPWDIRDASNEYAAILNMNVQKVRIWLENYEVTDTKNPTASAEKFLGGSDPSGHRWDGGRIDQYANEGTPVNMFTSIGGMQVQPTGWSKASPVLSAGQSNEVIFELSATGRPAFNSESKYITYDNYRVATVAPWTIVWTVRVEVVRTATWEIQRSRIGEELKPPVVITPTPPPEPGFWPWLSKQFGFVNPFNWPLKWQFIFWLGAGAFLLILVIVLLTQLGRSPVTMLMAPPKAPKQPKSPPKTGKAHRGRFR